MSTGRGHDSGEPPERDERDAREGVGPSDSEASGDEPDRSRPHPFDRVWLHPSELPPVSESPRSGDRRSVARTVGALVAAAVVGAVATVGALAALGAFDDASTSVVTPSARVVVDSERAPTLSDIVDAASPSVLEVRSNGPDGTVVGSGVVLRRDGEVLTAAANIADPPNVVVVDHRGDEHRARVLGTDRDSGLALLSVGATLRAASLSERDLDAGDSTISVSITSGGSPFVSEGLVAATDVRIGIVDGLTSTHFLATDTQPGPHGGGAALVDDRAAVTGIVLPATPGDTTTYAVPIEYALEIADYLRTESEVPRGWLGITGDDGTTGVAVAEVSLGGPASRAGVEPGDVIRAIDGRAVSAMMDLVAEVRDLAPGTAVELELLRESRSIPVEVEVGATPDTSTDTVVVRPVSLREPGQDTFSGLG